MAYGWEVQSWGLCQKSWLLNSRNTSYLLRIYSKSTLLISESHYEKAWEQFILSGKHEMMVLLRKKKII